METTQDGPLTAAIQCVQDLTLRVRELGNKAGTQADALYGQLPPQPNTTADSPAAPGLIGELHAALDGLNTTIEYLHSELQRSFVR